MLFVNLSGRSEDNDLMLNIESHDNMVETAEYC